MRNVLVLQHVAHEPLGTLNPLLKKNGLRIRYVNFERDPTAEPSLDRYNGLIVLGGPMGVYEMHRYSHLKHELKLIEQALKRDIPVLGICLGSQLLAHVLSSSVRPHTEKEMGWHDVHLTDDGKTDPVMGNFNASEKIFQMHGDTFDIPRSSEHLAFSHVCEGQAFRYGEKAYGFQFHLEVDQPMVLRWLKHPWIKKEMAEMGDSISAEKVLEQTKTYIQRSLSLSETTFGEFIRLFELPERPLVLDSGHGKPRGGIGF